ncbi:MAG TPA: RES domain-containing protein [Burkholderiales bacterium]|nr:RES domain-containing protein [Burkholderiales bacterium]
MKLWRIAAETRDHSADDLSGAGAVVHPGRWNDIGEFVVYCAPAIAMAVLETAAHIDDAGLPLNRFLVRIDVPDAIWARHEELAPDRLPAAWSAVPAGRASMRVGSAWLSGRSSAVLLLPSVIVPEERIALINPRHAQAARISAEVVRAFEYARLFRG